MQLVDCGAIYGNAIIFNPLYLFARNIILNTLHTKLTAGTLNICKVCDTEIIPAQIYTVVLVCLSTRII
jgi:hypothetical protein